MSCLLTISLWELCHHLNTFYKQNNSIYLFSTNQHSFTVSLLLQAQNQVSINNSTGLDIIDKWLMKGMCWQSSNHMYVSVNGKVGDSLQYIDHRQLLSFKYYLKGS